MRYALLAVTAGLLVSFLATQASAQVNDIVERKTDTGVSVWFPVDHLAADPSAAQGTVIRGSSRASRMMLMRPRLQFVPEMIKSVEAL